jgi:hypothetical protein
MNRTGFTVVRSAGVLLGFPWLIAACGGLVPNGVSSSGVALAETDGGTCCPEGEPDCACAVAVLVDGGVAAPTSGGGTVTEVTQVGCACPSNDPDCTCTIAIDAGSAAPSLVCSCDESGACACSMLVAADAGATLGPLGDGGVTYPPPATCPPGWQTPEGSPYLCCQTSANGAIDCFATGWSGSGQASAGGGVATAEVDAGAGPTQP